MCLLEFLNICRNAEEYNVRLNETNVYCEITYYLYAVI